MREAGETPRQKLAFQYFYELGKDRTYGKVCDKFGVSRAAVKAWADKYMWAERVEEKDAEVAREMKEKDEDVFIAEMEKNRRVIKASIEDFVKKLKEGKIQVDKVRDVVNLLRLDMDYVQFITNLKKDKTDKDEVDQDVKFTLSIVDELENKSEEKIESE